MSSWLTGGVLVVLVAAAVSVAAQAWDGSQEIAGAYASRELFRAAPPAPECRLLGAVDGKFEVYRCSGAGFERSCYVALAQGRMAVTVHMDCGG